MLVLLNFVCILVIVKFTVYTDHYFSWLNRSITTFLHDVTPVTFLSHPSQQKKNSYTFIKLKFTMKIMY